MTEQRETITDDTAEDQAKKNVSYDTVSQSLSQEGKICEINTYDSIPVRSTNDKGGIKNLIKKIYSFVAVFTVILSIVFSSAEILNIIFNDMGTGNAIIKHIFGRDIAGGSFNLSELIITNSFLTLTDKNSSSESTPQEEEEEEKEEKEESLKNNEITVPNDTVSETSPGIPNESPIEQPPKSESDKIQHPIISMDMSLISYGNEYIYNNTSLSPNISTLVSKKLNNYYQDEAPLVLIIHTHGTESYMPEGTLYYTDEGELARSQDPEENMIAVGTEFVRILEENGIKTLHCITMHDKESYRESYSRAAESIAKYLKEYPSIKYVFDLHRDSLMRSNGELISAVTSVNGQSHAQIMPVVGTGAKDWEENMIFALKLRSILNKEYTNLCRPICLRESTYNQNMAAVSVLLEIGTSGNTLTEAKNAAILTAEAIVELIKSP